MKRKVGCFFIMLLVTMNLIPVWAVTFRDVASNHWANEYIQTLSEQKVINGYEDGTFRPEGTITRAEFLKLVMAASIPSYLSMEDANNEINHWAGTYLWVAESYDVVRKGDIDINNIDEPITRIEMVMMISKADIIMKKARQQVGDTTFQDIEGCSIEQVSMLRHAFNKGLVKGYEDGGFHPNDNMTRAEAATMIYRYTN